MRRYSRVWVVYRKELIDTLRDRRTLIAMVLVPVVLYPVLMVVLVQALKSEKGRREAERYSICVPDEAHRAWLEGMIRREDAQRRARVAADRAAAEQAGRAVPDEDDNLRAAISAAQVDITVVGPEMSLWNLVANGRCHLAVMVDPPPDPDDFAGATNRIVQLIYRDTLPLSEFAFVQFSRILSHEADRIVQSRLARVPDGETILTPMLLNGLSTVGPDKQFAKILAAIVPFLLVIMTITGAMYPAIDLTAGERERGTLETLAVSPVPVGQIVAGKFGVVFTIAMLTTVLNLGSMTAMIHFTSLDQIATRTGGGGQAEVATVEQLIELKGRTDDRPGLTQWDYLQRMRALAADTQARAGFLTTAAPVVLLAMVPFAVLFSAIMLATCSFARTFKEAQNYMMPVMMCALIPAMVVSYMPSVRLQGALLVVPVANVVLMIRELFLGNQDVGAMAIALLSTCFYAVVAVMVAARLYGNEAVLFSDVGSYKTLLKRRFLKPRERPSASAALLLLAVIFPVNFYWQSSMLDLQGTRQQAYFTLAVSQVLIMAAPAIALAWYFKLDLRKTFSLRRPSNVHILGAVLMAASAFPVSAFLHRMQNWLVGASPDSGAFEQLGRLLFDNASPWMVVVILALLPGVCEELLFRGMLLSGLRGRLSNAWTLIVVGVLFGLFHVELSKIPQVSLMGMLLALVCLRSGSIFLSMGVHVANNGVPILLDPELGALGTGAAVGWLQRVYGWSDTIKPIDGPPFDWPTGLFLAVMAVGIGLLLRRRAEPQ